MSENYDNILEIQRKKVVDFIKYCSQESKQNEKIPRRAQNKKNWQYFHGDIDWSHKTEEDQKIHLHKVGIAAERIRSKFKQNLMNYAKWLSIDREYALKNIDLLLTEDTAKNLLIRQLEKADAKTAIADAVLLGAMEGRTTMSLCSKYIPKMRFVSKDGQLIKEEKKIWQLLLKPLGFENYLTDTFNIDEPLFTLEEFRTDYYLIFNRSSDEPSFDRPYRKSAVMSLQHFTERTEELQQKYAEGNTSKLDTNRFRKQVLIQNFYGTILNEKGEIFEWETENGEKYPLENIFCVVGNEDALLIDPKRNPRFTSKPPYVSTDLLRSPGNGHKAFMDAGTDLNQAMNELFSLMLDGAIRSAHNAIWYREDWIADKRTISGGIKAASAVPISENAPIGADPIGTIETGKVPQDAFIMLNTTERAFAENIISNQIDLSGNLPGKQLRATELVQASNSINDVFDSLAGDVEDKFIEPLLEECFYSIIEHLDEMDPDEVRACFGENQDKAEAFLQMPAKERFLQVSGIFQFKGKGLHGMMASAAKAQSALNLLNSLAANPLTLQNIEGEISLSKLTKIIIKGLGFDLEEVEPSLQEQKMIQMRQLVREQAVAMSENQGQGAQNAPNQRQGSQPAAEQPAGHGATGEGF